MEEPRIPAETWSKINALVRELYRTAGFPDLGMVELDPNSWTVK